MKICWLFLFALCPWLPLTAQNMASDTTQAHSYRRVGEQYLEQADYPAGNSMLQKALAIYQQYQLWSPYYETQNALAKGLWRSGKPDEAIDFLRQIVQESSAKLGEESIVAVEAYNNLGAAYGMKGYHDISLSYFDKSLRLRRRILGEHHASLGKAYHNIGVVLNKEGHYDDALDQLNKALAIKIENYGLDDKNLIGTYQVLGMVFIEKQAYHQALEYFQKALKLIRANFGELHPQTADGYLRLAVAYQRDQQTDLAFVYYGKAEDIAEQLYEANHAYRIPIYNNIGEAHLERGNSDFALAYFQKAYDCAVHNYGNQNQQALHILSNMGQGYSQQKKYAQAIECFQSARNGLVSSQGVKNADVAEVETHLAQQYMSLQRPDSALVHAHRSLLANIVNFSDTLLHELPAFETADYYSGQTLVQALLQKGHVFYQYYQQKGKTEELKHAHDCFQLALRFADKEERELSYKSDKAALLATAQTTYQWAVRICFELYQRTQDARYLHQAYAIAENNKSVLLSEALHESDAQQFGGIPDSIIRKERNLKIDIAGFEKKLRDAQHEADQEKINYYENQLFALRDAQRQVQDHLKENFNKYYQLKYQNQLADIKQIQTQVLAADQALIEYFYKDSLVYIFTITTDAFEVAVEPFADLDAVVRQMRQCLLRLPIDAEEEAQQRGRLIEAAHRLHRHLIAPLALPTQIQRLIIVPDGVLNYLPFDLLLDKKPTAEMPYADWSYLIKRYAISYSYTATLLHEFSQRPKRSINQKILALAPRYGDAAASARRSAAVQQLRGSLSDLPGAQEEVKRLQKRFGGTFLYGEEANERAFHEHLPQYGIVHLAMHGVLNHQRPSESALVLSENGDSVYDNLLFAYEINNLPIRADLVVLSACETGYGKFQHGEGSMSIARSFMYAGTHSLLMTMWEVNDQSTQHIMNVFYSELLDGKSKDIALQQAKLQYLQRARGMAQHPFLWAAFVPLGDSRPIELQSRIGYYYFLGAVLVLMALLTTAKIYVARRKRHR